MLPCPSCQRHVRAAETHCPFCATPLRTTAAPSPLTASAVALAAGLSLLACTDSGDGETNAVTTDPDSNTATGTSLGDGDGDPNETEDWGGGDYGGPAPCNELDGAKTIILGDNAVDLASSVNDWASSCGDINGDGPDELLRFTAPAAASFTFGVSAGFEGWLLEFGEYGCFPYSSNTCLPDQMLSFDLPEGATITLIVDTSAGASGTATVSVTQE